LLVLVIGLMLTSCGASQASGPTTTTGVAPQTSQPLSPNGLAATRVTEAEIIDLSGPSSQPSPVSQCDPAAVKQIITVSKTDLRRGWTRIVFTTTFQNTGSAPCGMSELRTCVWPGVILMNAAGKVIWQWNIPMLFRVCDPSVLYELPVSISSPVWTFSSNDLPPGSYTVSTDQRIVNYPPASTTFRVP